MKVIFDFDGTLCDITHRRRFVSDGNRDWKSFFQECVNDLPKFDVIKALMSHVWAGNHVEIWSGRSDEVRKESEEWLNKYVAPWAGSLLTRMRPAGDYTPDDELKRSWLYDEIAKGGKKPDLIYDDRLRVVKMWRAEGITCAQVDWGDFDSPKKPNLPRTPHLTVMVGASGAGKSTYLSKFANMGFVVSSDKIRQSQYGIDFANIHPDAYTHKGFQATFFTAHNMTRVALEGGVDVYYDATNIRRRDRIDLLKSVGFIDDDEKRTNKPMHVSYYVVERPLEEKLKSFNDNPRHLTNAEIITKHHQVYNSNRKYILSGDNIPGIHVKVI